MRRCPKCEWTYNEDHFVIDHDENGNGLVPYHGRDGRPCSLRQTADPKSRPCPGSCNVPMNEETVNT